MSLYSWRIGNVYDGSSPEEASPEHSTAPCLYLSDMALHGVGVLVAQWERNCF